MTDLRNRSRRNFLTRCLTGAAALGGPIFLTPENVQRIAQRPDEHYRQRALKL